MSDERPAPSSAGVPVAAPDRVPASETPAATEAGVAAAPGRGTIRILPPSVVQRIAAGEVVERPASVVKELVENALDAGARAVAVEVQGGGLKLIRVSDNGAGIPPGEVELAFARHSTSKLRSLADLEAVRTLGFRGEALASIAATAEVTLVTAVAGEEAAERVVFRAGQLAARDRQARPRGTTVTVRQLFAYLPARRRFLDPPRAESARISQVVRRFAVAHPTVRFTLSFDGRVALRTSGLGDLEALAEVYGDDFARAAVSVPRGGAGALAFDALLSGPELTRPNRSEITLVVNGRWVQAPLLVDALEAGYRTLFPRGRHPLGVVRIEAPPGSVDANVHPAKLEVRLRDERALADALSAAVREAFGRRARPVRPAALDRLGSLGGLFSPVAPLPRVAEEAPAWDADEETFGGVGLPRLRFIAQVQRSLLLAEGASALYLIDQHRAHERVLHDRLRAGPAPRVQGLLEPVVLELKPHEATRLGMRLEELNALGFACDWFGPRSFLVRSLPMAEGMESATADLAGVLRAAAAEEDDWQDRLFTQLACRTALRKGRVLSEEACRQLLRQLSQVPTPAICPHGAPIILAVSQTALAREFGW